MKRKLNFEMIPDGCWGYNLRTILSKRQWDYIRLKKKQEANGKCMICGRKTKRLEGHEVWSYNEEQGIQKLENVISVCHDCHSVIHIGRTSLKGDIERAEKHYMKVNGVSILEYHEDLQEANEIHKRRNRVSEWKLDLSYLKNFIDK